MSSVLETDSWYWLPDEEVMFASMLAVICTTYCPFFLHPSHARKHIHSLNLSQGYMIPAKLNSYGGGSAKFELEDGTKLLQRVKTDLQLDPLDPQCLDSNISNLIELRSLSEKAVLHILRIRFLKDEIYTLVSGILIACNPFKSMSIYDKESMDTYRRTRDHSTLPPHIFSLANEVNLLVL